MKVEREPNDDKTFLFDDASKYLTKKNVAIVSPIRQHIRKLDEKMKMRMSQSYAKKAKSHSCIVNKDNNKGNQDSKRYQRMKFMGIPVHHLPMIKVSHADLKAIVAEISQTSMLLLSHEVPSNNKSTPKRKHSNTKILPGVVKLMPKVPEFDCTMEDERECLRLDKFSPFRKAQPRGTNAKNLRVDKSLPWIEDELNATKVKLQKDSRNGKTFTDEIVEAKKALVYMKKKLDETPSAIKKSYNKIIASKFRDYNPPDNRLSKAENNEGNGKDAESAIEKQSFVSSSSLSSEGTYFTNDSGSVLMLGEQKILKSEMNVEKKFLVMIKNLLHYSSS